MGDGSSSRLAPDEKLVMTTDAEGQDLDILESAEATIGLSRSAAQ